jgi:hypothetical protein
MYLEIEDLQPGDTLKNTKYFSSLLATSKSIWEVKKVELTKAV